MSKQNMALLSQSEIDTLISFLSNEKDGSGQHQTGGEEKIEFHIGELIGGAGI